MEFNGKTRVGTNNSDVNCIMLNFHQMPESQKNIITASFTFSLMFYLLSPTSKQLSLSKATMAIYNFTPAVSLSWQPWQGQTGLNKYFLGAQETCAC